MERFNQLDRYQKGLLIAMAAMALIFAVVYPVTIARVGFEYKDKIFVPTSQNGGTVYSGKLDGKQAQFTVSADGTVVFQCGDAVYGPYTAKEDPTAIPEDMRDDFAMTGLELWQGEERIFRGAVAENDEFGWLYNEDGSVYGFGITYVTGGVERDENGNIIDPLEPDTASILKLMRGPALTHKGEWPIWFFAAAVCVGNTLWILFADELFRFGLSFQVRDPYRAEPSDWEIGGRYVGWTSLAVLALVFFVMGLQ